MCLGSLAWWRVNGGVRVCRCTRHGMSVEHLRIRQVQFFHMDQQFWLSSPQFNGQLQRLHGQATHENDPLEGDGSLKAGALSVQVTWKNLVSKGACWVSYLRTIARAS